MGKYGKHLLKALAIAIPFALGTAGYLLAGESIIQSMYLCVGLYGLECSEEPANLLIEFARWLAPLATAGAVLMIANRLRRMLSRMIARSTGASVAVFGPKDEKTPMLKALGKRGIDMEDTPVKAHSYILIGEEKENLDFYREHLADSGREVFVRCSSLPAQASNRDKLHLFCPEEMAARIFWDRFCPYERSVANDHQMTIVLIGFEKLGRQILLTALQNNIFDTAQHIAYHVIGQDSGFTQVYQQLAQIEDPVIFHEEPWFDALPLIGQAQMVIVAQQVEQLDLLNQLKLALGDKPLYVFSAQQDGAAFLAENNWICFDWKQEAMQPDNILCDKLYRYAKRLNLRYAHLYNGTPETDKARDAEWRALNTFTRYSNISAADYHGVQLKMLDGQTLTDEKLEWLAELEHIRWCRYHYLNNWRHGTPENGKNKDNARRIHTCLVPYSLLSEAEKEKDRENIRLLMKLDGEI